MSLHSFTVKHRQLESLARQKILPKLLSCIMLWLLILGMLMFASSFLMLIFFLEEEDE